MYPPLETWFFTLRVDSRLEKKSSRVHLINTVFGDAQGTAGRTLMVGQNRLFSLSFSFCFSTLMLSDQSTVDATEADDLTERSWTFIFGS